MLTPAQLKKHLHEHFDAEAARDVDWICRTVADDVEYHVIGPRYPDDPGMHAGPVASGREAVRQLWINYYSKFASYQIECNDEDMFPIAGSNALFAKVKITATPAEDFEGLPGGKPFRSESGALVEYNDKGEMTRETVYGSLGQILINIRRMRDFVTEGAKRAKSA